MTAISRHLAKERTFRALNELHLGKQKSVMGDIENLLGITKPAEGLNKPCQGNVNQWARAENISPLKDLM